MYTVYKCLFDHKQKRRKKRDDAGLIRDDE
jgi:hypothetical protein